MLFLFNVFIVYIPFNLYIFSNIGMISGPISMHSVIKYIL